MSLTKPFTMYMRWLNPRCGVTSVLVTHHDSGHAATAQQNARYCELTKRGMTEIYHELSTTAR